MPVWALWLKVCTQWRGSDRLLGLDYVAVLRVAELYGMDVNPDIFDGLRALEAEVLAEQQERMEEWQKTHRSK